jgi:hypothetical protein
LWIHDHSIALGVVVMQADRVLFAADHVVNGDLEGSA